MKLRKHTRRETGVHDASAPLSEGRPGDGWAGRVWEGCDVLCCRKALLCMLLRAELYGLVDRTAHGRHTVWPGSYNAKPVRAPGISSAPTLSLNASVPTACTILTSILPCACPCRHPTHAFPPCAGPVPPAARPVPRPAAALQPGLARVSGLRAHAPAPARPRLRPLGAAAAAGGGAGGQGGGLVGCNRFLGTCLVATCTPLRPQPHRQPLEPAPAAPAGRHGGLVG